MENRTAPTLPMLLTTPARATHDYQRNGTIDLFAALDIASDTVIADLRKTHTSDDFIAFLNKINNGQRQPEKIFVCADPPTDVAVTAPDQGGVATGRG